MKVLVVGCLVALSGAVAFAQEADDAQVAYDEASRCAGQFMWLLNASSGGQPPINEYSLDERVAGLSKLEALAKERAVKLDPVPDVANDILDVSDETIGVFFDDPDAVEDELYACAVGVGLREAE